MTKEYSVIGTSVPLIDAYEKVTGRLKYAGDLPPLPRMHYAKVLRSPFAHAKVVSIDTSKAEALEGVSAVITHKDIGSGLLGKDCGQVWVAPDFSYMGPPIGEEVCFVGDEVAAVSAVDEETALEALKLIDVEYEELPAIFDMEESIKPGAPPVRPWGPNKQNPTAFEWGNVEEGFKEADLIVEHRTTMGNQQHAPLDRNACIASWTRNDELSLWTTSQAMFYLREAICNFLGLPQENVRVYTPPTGGSFGFWWDNNFMFLAIILAKKAQRPVKLVLTRNEVQTTVKRRERPITRIKLGVKNDGKLIAQTHLHYLDNGAYGNKFDPFQSVADMYTTSHGRTEFVGVQTNLLTAGCMRGVGDLTLCYGLEQAIDIAAEKLNMDPVEFRLKNHFRPGDILHTSQEVMFAKLFFNQQAEVKLTSSGMSECIKKGAEMIGWKDKWRGWGKPVAVNGHKRIGIGMAISTHVSGLAFFGFNGIVIKVNSDGSIVLTCGIGRMGQGGDTTQAMVAAEVLGVGLEDIHYVGGDTRVCGHAMAQYASSAMHMVARATKAAAEDAKRQILELAATHLEADASDLDIKNKRIYVKSNPERGIELKKLMSTPIYKYLSAPDIIGRACLGVEFDKSGKMMMANFAEVEVDTRTGQLKVLKFVAVHDSGVIVNRAVVENQVTGGMFQAAGMVLFENLIFDEESGAILNPNFMDYKILGALDLPDPDIHFVEVVDEDGPFGAKGIGEGVTCAVPAAIASAVYNAIGVRLDPPSFTPDNILKALREKHA